MRRLLLFLLMTVFNPFMVSGKQKKVDKSAPSYMWTGEDLGIVSGNFTQNYCHMPVDYINYLNQIIS